MIFITPKILKTRDFWKNISLEELSNDMKSSDELQKEDKDLELKKINSLMKAYKNAGLDERAAEEVKKAEDIMIKEEEIKKLEKEIFEVK